MWRGLFCYMLLFVSRKNMIIFWRGIFTNSFSLCAIIDATFDLVEPSVTPDRVRSERNKNIERIVWLKYD